MPDHPHPTAQRYPAQHTGRDHGQLEALPDHGLARGHARSQDHPGQRANQPVYGEDNDFGAVDIDPRQQRRLLVATNGHGVAAIGGVVEQPAKEQEADDGDQDRYRYAKHLAVTKDVKRLLGHPYCLAIGKDIRQPAHDLHGRQGGDQRIDPQLGDDDAVDQADNQAHAQCRADTQKNAVGVAHDHRRHHAGAGNHRSHGQIEMPRRQAIEHGAGSNPGGGDGQAQATHVERRQEVVDQQGAEQKNRKRRQQHDPVVEKAAHVEFFAGCRQCRILGCHTNLSVGHAVSRAGGARPFATGSIHWPGLAAVHR